MGKHNLVQSDSDPEEDTEGAEEENYLVEVITKAKVVKDNQFQYRVKWYGYPSDDDSWEPEGNVAECKRLLKAFWKEVGKTNRKRPGPLGTVYEASNSWIGVERLHFRKEMRRQAEEEKKKKATKFTVEDDAPTKSKLHGKANVSVSNAFIDTQDSSESDERPLNTKAKLPPIKLKLPPRTTSASSSSKKMIGSEKLALQSSSVPKGKFSGMKISKKDTGVFSASPVDSPKVPLVDSLKSHPKAVPRIETSITTPSAGSKELSWKDADPPRAFLPPRPRPTMAPATSSVQKSQASSEDADNFLATVIPFGDSEAQKPANSISAPPTKITTPVPSGIKFAKRWSWAGELFFDTSDAAEKLCEITVHDTSESTEIGFRLGSALDSRDSLRFCKAYRRPELDLIFRALKKVDQVAKISHRKESDKEPLSVFMKYLERRKLVISSAVINTYGHVAEMIVFPSTDKELCKRLNIPLRYEVADCLLLALMPWHVPPSRYKMLYLRPDKLRDAKFETEMEEILREYPHAISRPGIVTAFRILGFNLPFLNFLPSRKYCVWSYQVDAKPTDRGRKFSQICRETRALFDIMSFLKAENAGYDVPDVRVVFVHVGSVRSIRWLPAIVHRRWETPEVRFVTYGIHEAVKPSMWGFHEIFPLGGVVTFTANALLESPLRMADLIEQIHKHPHWECYMLPSVLAIFVRLSCAGEDPLPLHAREPYHFGKILNLIEDGKIALMQSPSLTEGLIPGTEKGERDKWIEAQFATLVKTPLQHLEDCWSTFVAEYSNKTDKELEEAIKAEIVQDLAWLQTQQSIRENYRRFVVIKGMREDHIKLSEDGFEWRAAFDFDFGDEFPAQSNDLIKEGDVVA